MRRKLLVICGPTAIGKTSLALRLAKKFSGELISADSRQVYKWMNIGTGKDIPKGFEFRISKLGFEGGEVGFYTDGDTRIWGYDLVEPTGEFSVGQYVKIARGIIKDIGMRGRLPILVGGTGLYIKGVIDGIPTSKIPKDKNLRKSIEGKDANELFEILAQIDPVKAGSMNASDRKNLRRLVRAIEIASSKIKNKQSLAFQAQKSKIKNLETDTLFIGLTAPKEFLNTKIEKRVESRVKQGIEEEIRSLFRKGVTWKHQSMQAIGYRQWRRYFKKLGRGSVWKKRSTEALKEPGGTERVKAIEDWKIAEKQYAKRQMTWFKRDRRINWFDITDSSWQKSVEKLVKKWYSS